MLNNKQKVAKFVALPLISSMLLSACSEKPHDHSHDHDEKTAVASEAHNHADAKPETDEHAHGNHEEKNHEEAHHDDEHSHDEKHHDEKVEHIGKHVHGEAELQAVVEAKKVVLTLNTPAMNVLGFEHKPSTDEQKALVETQEAALKNGANLFTVAGGDCTVADVDVDMPFEEHGHDEHEEQEHEEKGHDEHAHEDKHDEKHDDEHMHDEHKHEDGSEHSDISATYTFNCKDASQIESINVNIFVGMAGFTKLNTQWIAGDKQGANTLTKEANKISFK